MRQYLSFLLKRFLLLVAVVVCGVSATFFVTHLSPVSAVETAIGRITSRSNFAPEAVAALRATLTDLYGTDRPLLEQFGSFWWKLLQGDLGPSLLAFPTPAMDLVARAMPWTLGLFVTSTIITWLGGNLLGGLAGYRPDSRLLRGFGIVAIAVQPIPYYIVAFILLIVFGFLWPVLPISGGFAMTETPGWNAGFVLSVLSHSALPALSLVLTGFGAWFLGMRALVSNIVTEDYVTYAELAGVDRRTVVGSYVIRNALVPQVTALALTISAVLSGTVITEEVFNYPGLGTLLIDAVNAGDFSLVLATSTMSLVAVAVAIFVVDALHPIIDPRVRTE